MNSCRPMRSLVTKPNHLSHHLFQCDVGVCECVVSDKCCMAGMWMIFCLPQASQFLVTSQHSRFCKCRPVSPYRRHCSLHQKHPLPLLLACISCTMVSDSAQISKAQTIGTMHLLHSENIINQDWNQVGLNGCVAPMQELAEPCPQVRDGHPLLLHCAPIQHPCLSSLSICLHLFSVISSQNI